ncbi:MAG: helix-turn-helix domain-containing protein [Sphaerobacter sp.]|nr:helix-turn-helix domain-containing protein [Sphaerobacter sp.]
MSGSGSARTGERELASDAMTIHQLAERSGVPPRRVRYYIAQGLLPAPIGRGRAAHYGRIHLERLRQIQALREANLGLDEIRARLGEPPAIGRESGPATVWRRWEVTPGVELHVREDVGPETARLARMLVGVARHLLGDADAAPDGRDEETE